MRHYRSVTSVLTLLVLIGIGAGCENVPQIAGPADQTPQFARVGGPSTTSVPVTWKAGLTGTASGVMPAGGGTLTITDGDEGPAIVRLIVPGGAAPGLPVEFTMALICSADSKCVVDLTANSVIGHSISRFHRGVQLQINTFYLVSGGGENLRIAQAHADGSFTSSPSSVDDDGFLTATLQHFSAYVPITD